MWRNVVAFFDDRRLWIISTVVYYVFWWSPSCNHFYVVIMFSAGGQPWRCHLPVRLRVARSADTGRKKVFVITNVLVEEHGFPHLLEENLSKKYIPLWLLYYYLRALVSPLRGKYIIEPCHEIFHPGCFLLQNSWVPSWTIAYLCLANIFFKLEIFSRYCPVHTLRYRYPGTGFTKKFYFLRGWGGYVSR